MEKIQWVCFYEVRKPADVSVSLWGTPLMRMTAKDERADRSMKLEWIDGGIRRYDGG